MHHWSARDLKRKYVKLHIFVSVGFGFVFIVSISMEWMLLGAEIKWQNKIRVKKTVLFIDWVYGNMNWN